MNTTRRYPIRGVAGDGFTVGRASGQLQVIMGAVGEWMLAVFFDPAGHLREVRQRPCSAAAGGGDHTLTEWKRDLGFEPGMIEVEQFRLPGLEVRISDRPWDYEEFVRNPEAAWPDQQELLSFLARVRAWDCTGRFVLQWGKDYWMNADGSINAA